LEKVKTNARFVVPKCASGFVIGKKGFFTKNLSEKYRVYLNFDEEPHNRSIRNDEMVGSLAGPLANVQDAICIFIERLDEYFKVNKKG
jgi:hypothetical protein